MTAPKLSDAELDAQVAQIEKDKEAGGAQYTRHFEDVLDEIHSSPSQAHTGEEPAETTDNRERKERAFQELRRAMKLRCNQMLDSHGLIVKDIKRSMGGRGFTAHAIDRVRRQYDCEVDFDTMGVQMQLAPLEAFRVACKLIVEGILKAQGDYARRAGLS